MLIVGLFNDNLSAVLLIQGISEIHGKTSGGMFCAQKQ
jgi:hypothetical protein